MSLSEMVDEPWYCPACLVSKFEIPFANASVNTSHGMEDDGGALFGNGDASTTTEDPLLPFSCLGNKLVLAHLNVRSLLPKIDQVRALLQDCEQGLVLGLSETWLDCSISDSELCIPEYTCHRQD